MQGQTAESAPVWRKRERESLRYRESRPGALRCGESVSEERSGVRNGRASEEHPSGEKARARSGAGIDCRKRSSVVKVSDSNSKGHQTKFRKSRIPTARGIGPSAESLGFQQRGASDQRQKVSDPNGKEHETNGRKPRIPTAMSTRPTARDNMPTAEVSDSNGK